MQELLSNELLWAAVLGILVLTLFFWRSDKSKKSTMNTGGAAASQTSKGKSQASVEALYEKAIKSFDKAKYAQAAALYREAAEQGHTPSQFKLGDMYELGAGVEEDLEKAFYWYKKAADGNNIEAQNFLGFRYETGINVEKNLESALYWYERAVENGDDDDAKFDLAILYDNEKRYAEGNALFLELAEKGHVGSQVILGDSYFTGDGIDLNYEQAFVWYKKAAETGDDSAQFSLAEAYHTAEGEWQDLKSAIYWYEKSAEQGFANAIEALAQLYEEDNELKKDTEKAAYWRQKAEELPTDDNDDDE